MTNGIALGIVLALATLIAADLMWFGWDLHIFLGRRFIGIVEWLAFWR